MLTLTEEQERITNYEYKQTLLCLRDKISKYHGKYKSKEFKEYLEALLMLEIDILKDKTYDEETLKKIEKIDFIQKIIEFNIYGSIRKLLETYDHKLTFPGTGYNGNGTDYPVWHKKIPILEIDVFNQIITLPEEIIVSPKLRYEQIDKLIEKLLKDATTIDDYINNIYNFISEYNDRYNKEISEEDILEMCMSSN